MSPSQVIGTLREKCPNTEIFSGPYFPVFGLSTGKCGPNKTLSLVLKILTRKNSVFGHFSRSGKDTYYELCDQKVSWDMEVPVLLKRKFYG